MVKKPLIRNLPSYLVQGTLLWPSFYSSIKVRIFWIGHKVWKNLPLKICQYSVTSNFKWKISSNFVALSEYPNFKKRNACLLNLEKTSDLLAPCCYYFFMIFSTKVQLISKHIFISDMNKWIIIPQQICGLHLIFKQMTIRDETFQDWMVFTVNKELFFLFKIWQVFWLEVYI